MHERIKPSEENTVICFTSILQDMADVIAVVSRCLKSIDQKEVAKRITKEVPKLFGANKCTLFMQNTDSGSKDFTSFSKHNCCCCGDVFLLHREKISQAPGENAIYCNTSENSCDEVSFPGPHLLIPLSGSDSDERACEAVEKPSNYLCMCDFPTSEVLDMERVSRKGKLIRDLLGPHLWNTRLYQEAQLTSLTDSMTRVGSRKLIEDELEDECARAQRYGRIFSMAVIDLDNFKTINDVLGHTAGDEALKKLAECMNHQKRKQDVLGRYGGDEFVILIPETGADEAAVLLERIQAEVKRIRIAREVSMSISCGIAQSLEDGTTTPRELFRRADLALYEAKNAGKDCVRIWDQNMSKRLDESDMEIEKIKRLQRRVAGLSERSEKMFIQSIWALVQALEAKDPFAKKHSEHVTAYARAMAETMGVGPRVLEVIDHAAMLHDIGKIGVPDAILAKPGPLNRKERLIVQQHPLIAVKILEKMTFLEKELEIVRHHHEAWNGQGYPDGLAGTSIPLGARILAVADTLDALTSPRAYRPPRSVSQAVRILLDASGYEFDPAVVEAAMCWIDGVRDQLGKTAELQLEDLRETRLLVAETTE